MERQKTEVKFYDSVDDSLLKLAVILAKKDGQWIFCKHRDRDTFEVPGGHREPGEDIIDTAKRELYEDNKWWKIKNIMINKIKNVAIVSLSSGLLGENFIKYETEIGFQRLKDLGLNVKCMPNSLKGIKYLEEHPEKRAEDLLSAFRDSEIDMILTAIGGDDTYRLLPYLLEDNVLADAVSDKVFLGFSDTTINHFMLYKVGLKTFYGQSFISDICELSNEMLPYTKKYFEELIRTGHISEVIPSDIWYEERKEYTPDQIGKPRVSHNNQGFELLQGATRFSGKILGGCIDSMYDMFNGDRYADMPVLCEKYGLFPDKDAWKGHIILLESSEEMPSPEIYRKTLEYLKNKGVFDSISGVLVGKPMDETYAEEYKRLLVEVIDNPDLPIVFNINIGHATPRCILPFGVEALVDTEKQVIRFTGMNHYQTGIVSGT